jgi:DNA processing protein
MPAMRVVARGDDGYPARLLDLRDPPARVHVMGDWPAAAPAVAVVGTRAATAYGERVTRELVRALGRVGVVVVSGMARGIDAAAHRGALEGDAPTLAVLGTGIDIAYPVAHASLHRELADRGAVLSEQPPGRRAFPGCFPRRNRLIAALADVTLVVEAGTKSGALITAGHALELGRTVAAVPGPIDVPQHRGANELLRDGAHVVASPDDLLALVGASIPSPAAPSLDADERVVWDALGARALDIDTLTLLSALPARRCMAAVTTMELRGVVECALTGEIRRR